MDVEWCLIVVLVLIFQTLLILLITFRVFIDHLFALIIAKIVLWLLIQPVYFLQQGLSSTF